MMTKVGVAEQECDFLILFPSLKAVGLIVFEISFKYCFCAVSCWTQSLMPLSTVCIGELGELQYLHYSNPISLDNSPRGL